LRRLTILFPLSASAPRRDAGNLQAAGLIHYSRGHITVLDRKGLEKRVCECYGVVKTEFDRLLPYRLSIMGIQTDVDKR